MCLCCIKSYSYLLQCSQQDDDMAVTDAEDMSSDEEANTTTSLKLDGGVDVTTPVVRDGTASTASQHQTNRKRESKKSANFRATLNWMHRDPNAPNIDAANYEVNGAVITCDVECDQ